VEDGEIKMKVEREAEQDIIIIFLSETRVVNNRA